MKCWRWLALAAWLVVLVPAQAADKMVLTSGVLAPCTTLDRKGFLDQLIAAVYREVGLEAELPIYPTATERGMLNANEGVDDGLARTRTMASRCRSDGAATGANKEHPGKLALRLAAYVIVRGRH